MKNGFRLSALGFRVGSLCVLSVFCGVLFSGCGYQLAGRGSFLPDYIKTIGVPTFENRTTLFNLETQVTQKVRSEFIGRGHYQIVPEATNVDAVLTGVLSGVSIQPVNTAAARFTLHHRHERPGSAA